ncbi:MAG TPA: RNA polymerase sigma factor [Candidatus Goldiibacteriota bacterium]|nr:RNA polymerase sigma factor [Candidatus Goldiibacteriota bacterium]
MDRTEEQAVIERARKDPKAFEPIFDKYYSAIFRYAMHRTGNAAVAGDIAAETFFKALNKLHTYRVTAAPFSSWLYRIASNEASYYFRRRKYEPASYDAAIEEGGLPEPVSRADVEKEYMEAQEAADRNRDFLKAKELISKLPLLYQEVLVLRFLEDKKICEIAEILGKREGTIKSLISRGVEKLRKGFKP